MAKKVQAGAGKGNNTPKPLSKAAAARTGKMFEELLALDLTDNEKTKRFAADHLAPAAWQDERLIPLLGWAADLLNMLRQDLTVSGDPRRVMRAALANADGTIASRARVVMVVKDGLDHHMKEAWSSSAVSEWIIEGLVRQLADVAPEFHRLPRSVAEHWLTRLQNERYAGGTKTTSLTLCAAAFSFKVGAFGDRKRPGETDAAAARRVEKSYRNAMARAASRASNIARSRNAI